MTRESGSTTAKNRPPSRTEEAMPVEPATASLLGFGYALNRITLEGGSWPGALLKRRLVVLGVGSRVVLRARARARLVCMRRGGRTGSGRCATHKQPAEKPRKRKKMACPVAARARARARDCGLPDPPRLLSLAGALPFILSLSPPPLLCVSAPANAELI
ncbi:hypothetical protein ZWY2020_018067 [Hordeum vulgare]|nr:hypothetical protein ZWY2020_018067 [Hordeum vulgare]